MQLRTSTILLKMTYYFSWKEAEGNGACYLVHHASLLLEILTVSLTYVRLHMVQ